MLTNPDMLHVGILPNHALWASFFRQPALCRHRRGARLPRRLWLPRGLRAAPAAPCLCPLWRTPAVHPARRPSPTRRAPARLAGLSRWSSTTTAPRRRPRISACGTRPSWIRPGRRAAAPTARPRDLARLVAATDPHHRLYRARRVAELILLYARRGVGGRGPERPIGCGPTAPATGPRSAARSSAGCGLAGG
jgi:hypothetical protein